MQNLKSCSKLMRHSLQLIQQYKKSPKNHNRSTLRTTQLQGGLISKGWQTPTCQWAEVVCFISHEACYYITTSKTSSYPWWTGHSNQSTCCCIVSTYFLYQSPLSSLCYHQRGNVSSHISKHQCISQHTCTTYLPLPCLMSSSKCGVGLRNGRDVGIQAFDKISSIMRHWVNWLQTNLNI